MGRMKDLDWKLGDSLMYLTNTFSASTMCWHTEPAVGIWLTELGTDPSFIDLFFWKDPCISLSLCPLILSSGYLWVGSCFCLTLSQRGLLPSRAEVSARALSLSLHSPHTTQAAQCTLNPCCTDDPPPQESDTSYCFLSVMSYFLDYCQSSL